jgi:pimeloyl-ACP methyl ester carboxylesterase
LNAESGIATALDGRTRLYWETTGDGPPVLLVHGLGLSGGAWWRTVETLSPQMRVITFDNRGIGRSESLAPAYTTEAMADDAVAVLDHLGLDRVHAYGISLGGMVVQQLTLRHPRRVMSLVLGATHPGGRRAVRAGDDVMAFFRRRSTMQMEEAAWASVVYNYGPRAREQQVDRIADDIERRLSIPFNEPAYRAQLFAAVMHNCYGRLDRVSVPAFVVHGSHDRVIPVQNAHLLADRIPEAKLRILPHAGHLYPTEEPAVDEEIGDFFAAHC